MGVACFQAATGGGGNHLTSNHCCRSSQGAALSQTARNDWLAKLEVRMKWTFWLSARLWGLTLLCSVTTVQAQDFSDH